MFLRSENIIKYIENNIIPYGEEIKIEDLSKVERLNINELNYKMEIAPFYPKELEYLINLKECKFCGFLINDEIIESINKLSNLKKIEFDNCRCKSKIKLEGVFEEVNLNISNIRLLIDCDNCEKIKKVRLQKIDEVDIAEFDSFIEIEYLEVLNCKIKNFSSIIKIPKLKYLKIIGNEIDDISELENLKKKINVEYFTEEYRYMD